MKRYQSGAFALLLLCAPALFGQASPPTITSLSPSQTTAGAASFTLTVTGTGYGGGATLLWSTAPAPLIPSSITPTQMTVTIDASLITTPGFVTVRVSSFNSLSNAVYFTINPQPAITTTSPLPSGQVGVPYSVQLQASGGTPPYNWTLPAGPLPPGLTLGSNGVLSGVPTQPGAFSSLRIAVTDSTGVAGFASFTLTVNPAALVITTASPLASGTAGAAYLQSFAATGGTGGYTWSVTSGSLPAGLTLSAAGTLNGTPAQLGTYNFTLIVTDNSSASATQAFTLTVNPALVITTASPLPGGTVGAAYSQTLAATGGVTPYSWSISAGSLPSGLTLSAAGVLSGTPTQAASFSFTVKVADNSGGSATQPFTLTVPAPPTLSITGLSATVDPAQQPPLSVQLSSAYTNDIAGTITLTFTPDAVNPVDNNPQIGFSTGGTTLGFTIQAGNTQGKFLTSPPGAIVQLQVGNVAGRITLTVSFGAGGQNISSPPISVQIARSAPVITSVKIVRTSYGFDAQVTGYATPRQVTQAVFTFTGASTGKLQTTQLTVAVDSAFTTWYTNASSTQYGSSFLYTQPFTVQGNVSDIASVSLTLANAQGTSPSSSPVSP